MTMDEARKWIEQKVLSEVSDAHKPASHCEEIALHFWENLDDQPIFVEVLSELLTNQHLRTPEQVANAAYLVVNFGERGLLDLLVSRLTQGEEYDESHVRIVMEAIRNGALSDADGDDAASQGLALRAIEGKSAFLPFLIACSRHKEHAGLAYEILSQLYPEDMISYFLWTLGHHSSDIALIQTLLTHLFFDERKETPRLFTLEVIRDLWSQLESAVDMHPSLPEEAKLRFPRIEGVRREMEEKLEAHTQELEAWIEEHTSRAERMEAKLTKRERQLDRMDRTVHQLTLAQNRTKGVIKTLEAEHRRNREQILNLRAQLSSRDRQLKTARAELMLNEEEVKEKDEQIHSLTGETTQASQTIEDLKSNLEAQAKRINEMEAALQKGKIR